MLAAPEPDTAGLITDLSTYLTDQLLEHQRFMNLTSMQLSDLAEIIADKALLLRFLKKHKFHPDQARLAVIAHFDWRITERIEDVSVVTCGKAVESLLDKGLFRFSKTDRQGRPVVYIDPRIFVPESPKASEDLKMGLVVCFETLRRWIHALELTNQTMHPGKTDTIMQALVVVNLEGFGVANMDFKLIPVIYDLFRVQFPQLLGQVLVLNYGWMHAALWSSIGSLLNAEARSKLVFIDQVNLTDYIPHENIPAIYGGLDKSFPISYKVCPIIQSFALPIHQQQRHESVNQIMSILCSTQPDASSSVSSVEESFYDCASHISGVRSITSTADLQDLLPSRLRLGGGISRTQSNKSLTSLTLRSRSHLRLHDPTRSRSHVALSHFAATPYAGQGLSTVPHRGGTSLAEQVTLPMEMEAKVPPLRRTHITFADMSPFVLPVDKPRDPALPPAFIPKPATARGSRRRAVTRKSVAIVRMVMGNDVAVKAVVFVLVLVAMSFVRTGPKSIQRRLLDSDENIIDSISGEYEVDPKQPEKEFYSYYNAFHLNKTLFQTQICLKKRYIHRLHVLNPLTNSDIIGQVTYYLVKPTKTEDEVIIEVDGEGTAETAVDSEGGEKASSPTAPSPAAESPRTPGGRPRISVVFTQPRRQSEKKALTMATPAVGTTANKELTVVIHKVSYESPESMLRPTTLIRELAAKASAPPSEFERRNPTSDYPPTNISTSNSDERESTVKRNVISQPPSGTLSVNDDRKVVVPAGTVTRYAVAIPLEQLSIVIPQTKKGTRRSLSYRNAVSASNVPLSFLEWANMINEENEEINKTSAHPDSSHQYDTVSFNGPKSAGPLSVVADRPLPQGFSAASPSKIVAALRMEVIPDQEETDSVRDSRVGEQPRIIIHQPPDTMVQGEPAQQSTTLAYTSDTPKSPVHSEKRLMIYDALFFATDDDFLEGSKTREIFRAHSINTDDSKLFEMKEYTGEEGQGAPPLRALGDLRDSQVALCSLQ